MRSGILLTIVLLAATPVSGVEPVDVVVNSVGMKLAYIPPGEFTMGSPKTEPGRIANETERHVTFEKGFRIGVTEVTQKEWRLIMGTNPSFFTGDDLPVERITWREAVEYCRRLSEKENKPYRLPTEAEWEYACRAGTTTVYFSGEDQAALAAAGWYLGNSGNQSHPVGRKNRTHGDCTTCTATSRSGVRNGQKRNRPTRPPRNWTSKKRRCVICAAARGA